MQGVADWLEELGLSEYAQCFADNAIDLSVLPDLTDQDLEKIGVLLGHRRKMLKAHCRAQHPERFGQADKAVFWSANSRAADRRCQVDR
jgi:hypothetical protein